MTISMPSFVALPLLILATIYHLPKSFKTCHVSVPCSSTLFTATALFDVFSSSGRILYSASTGLHEVLAAFISH